MSDRPCNPDWSSDWKEDELDKLRRFRALSASEKIRRIESLNETVRYLLGKPDPSVVRESNQTQKN